MISLEPNLTLKTTSLASICLWNWGFSFRQKNLGAESIIKSHALFLTRRPIDKFISDISGQDISAHNNANKNAIRIVRDWLSGKSRRTTLPDGDVIWKRYQRFMKTLPKMCKTLQFNQKKLIYKDYIHLVYEWLEELTWYPSNSQ